MLRPGLSNPELDYVLFEWLEVEAIGERGGANGESGIDGAVCNAARSIQVSEDNGASHNGGVEVRESTVKSSLGLGPRIPLRDNNPPRRDALEVDCRVRS